MASVFDQLCEHVRETACLASIEGLLGWDERTIMPPGAGSYRAEQLTYLAGMIHRRRTDPRLGEWLGELLQSPLNSDAHSDSRATIRQLKRQYDRLVKVPQALVEELTRTTVLGQQQWVESRGANEFGSISPLLKKIIDLKRQQAEAIGYEDCAYDALLDQYEPGETTANVRRVLDELRRELVPLVAEIRDASHRPDTSILRRSFPISEQESFGRHAATSIGFDFGRGRLDVTHHPFCSDMGPDDCRITTRYDEHYFNSGFFGILHEAGHGIYQQGLRTDWFGLPPGEAVSLGIHESQSRMWENGVGRSRAFWEHFFPQAQARFASLADVTLDEFYFAANAVAPSLIRVEADEATYNLHIIIRFELEQALIDDQLPVDDLPAAWNEKHAGMLGIQVPSDADGVLQDIHWSAGLIGYFPTYSLGNLYAAQIYNAAEAELGDLSAAFAGGQFQPLKRWLNRHVHQPGQCLTAAELARQTTGSELSHQPLVSYLRQKLGPLYGI